MHSHASANGLAFADSLANRTLNMETIQEASRHNTLDPDDTITPNHSSADSDDSQATNGSWTPAATLQQDNVADLFAQLHTLNQQHKHSMSKSLQLDATATTPEPAEEGVVSSAESSPVDLSMPRIHESVQVVIEETPHEMAEPKVLSVWALKDGGWHPAYILDVPANNGKIYIKFAGDEAATTLFAKDTRPLDLNIGESIVNVDGLDGEFQVIDLVENVNALYKTRRNFSRVEVVPSNKPNSKPEMVDIEKIYLEDQKLNPPKRHRNDGHIFENCVFAITKSGDHEKALNDETKEIIRLIQKHGGSIIEKISTLVDIDDAVEWVGPPNLKFGAVIAPRQCQTPKFLQALAIGWPCLSFEFIYKSIDAGSLAHHTNYIISSLQVPTSEVRLETQFYTRPIILGPIVTTVCLLGARDSPLYPLMVLACAKPVFLITELSQAPHGSLVVHENGKGLEELPVGIKEQLPRKLRLMETISVSRDWLIRCVNTGTLL